LNIWQTVRDLQKQHNMTVFLTTHYMEEAAAADYIIIIDDGEIAVRGTPDELRMKYSSDSLKLRPKHKEELLVALQGWDYAQSGDTIVVKLQDTLQAIPLLQQCQDLITNVEIVNGSMDDVFINITGKEIRK
jgi:multidrug/hemolysin transport system ATP-binding protein